MRFLVVILAAVLTHGSRPEAPETSVLDRILETADIFEQPDLVVPEGKKCVPQGGKSNLLYLSNGLSTPGLRQAFREFSTDFVAKKKGAGAKPKALIFWDSCFMMESVWNKDWKCSYGDGQKNTLYGPHNWTSPDVAHYEKFKNPLNPLLPSGRPGRPFTNPDLLSKRQATDGIPPSTWSQDSHCEFQSGAKNFQPYWCEDFGEVFTEDGIEFEHLSLIDTLATDDFKKTLPSLNMPTWDHHHLGKNVTPVTARNEYDKDSRQLIDLLGRYDIIAFDGGNPDLHRLGLSLAGPKFRQQLSTMVNEGQLLFMGRSAGAIINSKESVTFEPNPTMWHHFQNHPDIKDFWPADNSDRHGLDGMDFVDCGVRPHFNEGWEVGVQSFVSSNEGTKIARLRNNAGLFCSEGSCIGISNKVNKNTPFVSYNGDYGKKKWNQTSDRLANIPAPFKNAYGLQVYALQMRLAWMRLKANTCGLEQLKDTAVASNPCPLDLYENAEQQFQADEHIQDSQATSGLLRSTTLIRAKNGFLDGLQAKVAEKKAAKANG